MRCEWKRWLGLGAAAAACTVFAWAAARRATGAEGGAKGDPPPPSRLERIRAAAPMPRLTGPVPFDTPEADAVVSALEIFPPDNPWNQPVADWPVHPNSAKLVAAVGADKVLRANDDMAYVLVPPDQPKVDVKLTEYQGESDKGPYPVPANVPIEGWPSYYKRNSKTRDLTLDDVQRDKLKMGGDRHAIVVDPTNRMLYEFYALRKTDSGWTAAGAAIFDLKSNKLRPDTWTSTDAAGLPIFPAIARYDEFKRGQIDHPLRVTIPRSRKAYVYPATHHAGHARDENLPRMGERFRLKKDFDVSGFSREVRILLTAMKQYGLIVADNGISWAVSIAPDERIPQMHEELRKVKGKDFEAIEPPPGYQRAK